MARLRVSHPKLFYAIMLTVLLLLVWNASLITFATYMMFTSMGEVSAAITTAYSTLVGIMSAITAFVAKKVGESK